LQERDISYHCYDDDTKLPLSFDSSNSGTADNRPKNCLADIRSWMSDNFFKFNADNSECILIGNPKQVAEV